MLRYKPFTGFLPVLPQYSTAQYSPSDSQYRPFPALYRLLPVVLPSVQYYPLFPERTSFSTVLPGPLPGTRYLQDPVPGVRAFVLLPVQYYRPLIEDQMSRLPPDLGGAPCTLCSLSLSFALPEFPI